MDKNENGFLPGSSKHWEYMAEAAADDDNYDGIGNNFYAGYCYYRAAKEGRKEEKNK